MDVILLDWILGIYPTFKSVGAVVLVLFLDFICNLR